MRHARAVSAAAILAVAGMLILPVAREATAEITAKQVQEALDRGVDYLKGQQRADGSWPEWLGYNGGVTALCTLALLHAGEAPDSPVVQKALAWLRRIELEKTYVVSLQTMVFCKAEPKKDLLLISRNVKWLQKNQVFDGPRKGAWAYPGQAGGDNSNSQFALLALYEAERAGVEVDDKTWRLARAYWEEGQLPGGGWGYYKGLPPTGSMTCAGIASMVITSDMVFASGAEAEGGRIRCCIDRQSSDNEIQRGLQWLARNFSVSGNPGARGQTWMLYYLYGVERVGRLTAHRFIGEHDWYREGADVLVRSQDQLSGYWKGVGHAEDNPHIATSFALLFLSKGRRPVLLSKLRYGPDDHWNRHRSDVANLTRYVESQWKREMTWQVVDAAAASVDDLLQSPVLYLVGSRSPLPSSEEAQVAFAQKLRDYLDRGGFLMAEGYCGGGEFDRGFRRLLELVFPEPEYRLRLLPASHPIWRAEEPVPPDQVRPLWGVEFGCRTSVLYAPLDPPERPRPSLSCLWELARTGRGEELPAGARAEVAGAKALGINILAYATNRQLKYKDEIPAVVTTSAPKDTFQRGRVYIASLRHPGGCDAAPRALANLLETAGAELRLRTTPARRQVALTDDALFAYHLVFMHGRTSFRLTEAEREQLATFIERGGMLFADSICASQAFTESFRREMAAVFPERKLEAISPEDPMLSPEYGGFDLSTVTRRDPQSRDSEGPLKANLRQVPPLLEGIRLDDRWAVVFSPFDISCALEKHASLECQGYTREDAARIGLNVILYSLQQ